MIDTMAGADKSWLLGLLCLPLVTVLSECSLPSHQPGTAQGATLVQTTPDYAPASSTSPAQSPTPPAPPPPLSPFADAAVSFLIRGHFVRGEQVVVRICLHADHSIASSAIVESSGDRRFDEMALDWARRMQLRTEATPGHTIARCGSVRVELRDTAAPGMGRSVGEQLG